MQGGTGLTPGQGTRILHATSAPPPQKKNGKDGVTSLVWQINTTLDTIWGQLKGWGLSLVILTKQQVRHSPDSIRNPCSNWDSISLGLTCDDLSPKPKYYIVKLHCSHHHRAMWPDKQIHCPFYHSHWELFSTGIASFVPTRGTPRLGSKITFSPKPSWNSHPPPRADLECEGESNKNSSYQIMPGSLHR